MVVVVLWSIVGVVVWYYTMLLLPYYYSDTTTTKIPLLNNATICIYIYIYIHIHAELIDTGTNIASGNSATNAIYFANFPEAVLQASLPVLIKFI